MFVNTMDSAAWRATSHGARSLFLALKRRYNRVVCGAVYLSSRMAADELGSNRNYIRRWFRELQFFGFIVMMTPGYLGVEGRGKAPHWRITDEWYHGEPPTRDFHKWDGTPFHEQKPLSRYLRKKQNPGSQSGATVGPKVDPVVGLKVEPPPHQGGSQSGAIENEKGGSQSGAVSRVTISDVRVEAPRPVWTTPVLVELPWSDEWARLYAETEPADDLDIPAFLQRAAVVS
jgi:hypothetical protein